MQRGVSKEAAAAATDSIEREAELESAKQAAAKKWRSLKGEPFEQKRKLMAFLMRRGFSGDIVKDAIKSIDENDHAAEFESDDGLMLDN
ncbi:recombination regulator RecX [compost metagenome]